MHSRIITGTPLPKTVVGITGFKRVGKTESANYIAEKYQFKNTAFADRLKEFVDNVFCFVNRGDADKETDAHCLIQESTLYKEIKLLQVHSDDVESLVQSFIQTLAYHSKYGILPCDVGFFCTISRRLALQLVGSEVFRYFDESFWLNRLDIYSTNKIVISDVRFQNEQEFVKRHNGTLIKIVRDSNKQTDGHISEAGIADELCNYVVENNGTLGELYAKLDVIMENIKN